MKNTPTEYHDIFSNPEKMFLMKLITPNTFLRITTEIPTAFDKTKDYYIDFVFENGMWDMIPVSTPFTLERWMVIRDHNASATTMFQFANKWIREHLSPERRKELIDEYLTLWKRRNSFSKQFVFIAQYFGATEYLEYLEYLEKEIEERKTPPKKSVSMFDRTTTRAESYAAIKLMVGDLSTKSSGYSGDSDCKFNMFDGCTGYGSNDCGSDDDTLSPTDDDDEDRLDFMKSKEC
ncbi:MAG: hypothetical protein PHG66_00305 [Candidatus Colwellbacteria bacterium]|nr:hypothetical protein [Candidatus Colwellbacteria bacterium]